MAAWISGSISPTMDSAGGPPRSAMTRPRSAPSRSRSFHHHDQKLCLVLRVPKQVPAPTSAAAATSWVVTRPRTPSSRTSWRPRRRCGAGSPASFAPAGPVPGCVPPSVRSRSRFCPSLSRWSTTAMSSPSQPGTWQGQKNGVRSLMSIVNMSGRRHGSPCPATERKVMATSHSGQHLWIVGGGIAGMAAAASHPGRRNPRIQHPHPRRAGPFRGSMDGAASPSVAEGYVTRGGRMFEDKAYQCTWIFSARFPPGGPRRRPSGRRCWNSTSGYARSPGLV